MQQAAAGRGIKPAPQQPQIPHSNHYTTRDVINKYMCITITHLLKYLLRMWLTEQSIIAILAEKSNT